MFVINTPYIFSAIWAFIKPYLDPRTQAKITVLGSNYLEALFLVIDKENLPEFLGGTLPYNLENVKDVGPWDTTYTSKEDPEKLKQGEKLEHKHTIDTPLAATPTGGSSKASSPTAEQKGDFRELNEENGI